jgi:hypothetical protein
MAGEMLVQQVPWAKLHEPYRIPDGWELHSVTPGFAAGTTSTYAIVVFVSTP